ncbi:MAG: D-alanyl-D-alanine carboxypeptidase/D-alanyl-D-alanine-endopeptidase [Bacteroidota bacterium]|nr:D-alanyl-D-alanine carboxypeptidase/D-alanyl-D-alanine-endopeptidase [Bacteroidota bacterium]MDW8271110.1 D-alanyl-D-alanine carboxypeptidase/D-alanyl-D-alanine-endopeptidase [Bacteroidota bacterium]
MVWWRIATLVCFIGCIALLYAAARQGNPSPSSGVDYSKLAARISELLYTPMLRGTRYGVVIHALDRDTTIYAIGTQELLTPASLTKLYFTAAAFTTMGADFPVRTLLATDGNIRNGVLEGNLYLIGHGDCLLRSTELEALAEKIYALGIRRIQGSIIADATYFDPVTDRQQYSGDNERMEDLPPISALGVDGNKFTVIVTRGSGNRVQVRTLPSSSAITVTWTPLPVRVPSSQPKQLYPRRRYRQRYGDRVLYRQRPRRAHRTSVIHPIRVSSSLRTDGIQEIRVVGTPPVNSSVSFAVTMLNPPLATAGALQRCLEASGITIDGRVTTGSAPPTVKEIGGWQRLLRDIVAVCNKNSDNFAAEHLMKILGAYCCGNVSCNVNAYRTVVAMLDSAGIESNGCIFYDGSGLSRRNRITVSSLIGLLKYCARQPWGELFFGTLAVAGEDGTLYRRMRHGEARGNLRAKTGTHRNVSGLAGIVRAANGERFLLAALWNGNNVGIYKQLENQLGELVASFGLVSPPAPSSNSDASLPSSPASNNSR